MTAIVFDLDGTLIDSAPDIRAATNAMLADEGLEPLDLPTIISFIGNGIPHLVRLVMEVRGLDMARHEALTASMIGHYHTGDESLTTLYSQVREVLETLHGNGYPLGLCTNKPIAPTREILDQFGLTNLFSAVIGGDSLAQRKPHPAPLVATFEALGGARGETGLYVGDSEVDAQTAHRAGVPFALFTEGYRKTPVALLTHKWSFSDFGALPEIVAASENLPA